MIGTVSPNCVTPDNMLGACIDTKYCVTIMTAIVNNDHITNPAVAKFLRESQCGIRVNSQKVCCNVNSIDFGDNPTTPEVNVIVTPPPSTVRPTFKPNERQPTPPPATRNEPQQQQIDEKCGKLSQNEEPFKWIGEIWFKRDRLGGIIYESRCLGSVISPKHIVVPAHCVASLPADYSL